MRTQYLYDDVTGACIAEFDENGDTQVEYTTNPQTGELISENHNGQEVLSSLRRRRKHPADDRFRWKLARRGDLHRLR